jgi:hypothetical protein
LSPWAAAANGVDSREVQPPQEREFVRALFRRVQLAVTDAERTVARARALASLRRVLGDTELLVRRCAWCGSV